jgi:NAD(P)-dependent dehydrogenase (short-subunit alcohol dehydrogenase family)
VVLTGATDGIGRATALLLASEVGHLILHGRKPVSDVADLLDAVRASIQPASRLDYVSADFGELAQVDRMARDIRGLTDRIDVLINNAGRAGPPTRTATVDGNEITLQTNYLAPVALTDRLIDLVGNASAGRVVNVGSATHFSASLRLDDLNLAYGRYSPTEVYAHSKLALIMWSCWLAAHRPRPSVEVVCMHPGVISTKVLGAMFSIGGNRPEQAASDLRFVAQRHGDNGAYYDRRRPAPPNPEASDSATEERLHEVTSRLVRDPAPS